MWLAIELGPQAQYEHYDIDVICFACIRSSLTHQTRTDIFDISTGFFFHGHPLVNTWHTKVGTSIHQWALSRPKEGTFQKFN